jgi:hypothetical protein
MMSDRKAALDYVANTAADCVQRLDMAMAKGWGWLGHLTPEEAQLLFKARQACDFLYVATNKAEQHEGQVDE